MGRVREGVPLPLTKKKSQISVLNLLLRKRNIHVAASRRSNNDGKKLSRNISSDTGHIGTFYIRN